MGIIRRFASATNKKTITYIGGAKAQGNTVDLSGIDIRSGDLIVYLGSYGWHTTVDGTPTSAGYTKFPTLYAGSSDRNSNTMTGYKIADGTETSFAISSSVATIVKVFRNVDQDNPFDVTRTTATQGSNAYPNPPANTPTTRGTMALVVASCYTSGTMTASSLDEFDFQTQGSVFNYVGGAGFGIKELPTFNEYDPVVWGNTQSSNADTNWGAITMILRPA